MDVYVITKWSGVCPLNVLVSYVCVCVRNAGGLREGCDLQWESTVGCPPVARSRGSCSTDACPPQGETAGGLQEATRQSLKTL